MSGGSASADAAWAEYRSSLEEVRQAIYAHPAAQTREGAAGALYLFHQIQAVAFNVAIAPRQESPRFFSHAIFEPGHYTWTSPGSDYLYRKAFVDGSRRYRIWGRRGSSHMLLLQAMGGYWNSPAADFSDLGSYDLDRFVTAPDGRFELIASASPEEGHWIRLDASKRNICLMVREIFQDWDAETVSELHIEPLDADTPPQPLTEDELIERLRGAARFMRFTTAEWSAYLVDEAVRHGGYNRFADAELETAYAASSGINPAGGFYTAAYDVSGGKALIIEIHQMKARYWGIQLSDVWHQNTDYLDHQTSLNGGQVAIDDDGVVRMVVSMQDPGIWNWLDPVGLDKGGADFRFLEPQSQPIVKCRVVGANEVLASLPAATRRISPDERKRQLIDRRRAGMRRWGY